MQDLIERISKIEEATERIRVEADEEKKRIEAQIQSETAEYDAALEADTEKKLQDIREDYRIKADAALKAQRETADRVLAQIAAYYEKAHVQLGKEICGRIIKD